jgi:aminopeptidase
MIPEYKRLAEILVHHSTRLEKGERVLIQASEIDPVFIEVLLEEIARVGAIPLLMWGSPRLYRKLIQTIPEEGFSLWGEVERFIMEKVQAYIGIRGGNNTAELSDLPQERMDLYRRYIQEPVHTKIRVPRTKWVVLRWPTPAFAQSAGMSTEGFWNFYFQVTTMDYGRLERALIPLKELMERTDEVRILGPGPTDLRFSIRGIPAIPCFGLRNIPDGECFTAPVRESVEGIVRFNAPSVYEGVFFDEVEFRFHKGKIVEARSRTNEDRLNAILDSDEGARYLGEFSIGVNPYILHPMRDILFDEKIAGSIHLTPGNAYEIADNHNRSRIHWDLVLIQRPEFGGGEIWFDGKLIRKDGRFVLPELEPLNPENLRGLWGENPNPVPSP